MAKSKWEVTESTRSSRPRIWRGWLISSTISKRTSMPLTLENLLPPVTKEDTTGQKLFRRRNSHLELQLWKVRVPRMCCTLTDSDSYSQMTTKSTEPCMPRPMATLALVSKKQEITIGAWTKLSTDSATVSNGYLTELPCLSTMRDSTRAFQRQLLLRRQLKTKRLSLRTS